MNPIQSLSAITRRALRINYTSPAICTFTVPSSGSGSGSGVAATLDIQPVVRRDGPAQLSLTKPSLTSVKLTWTLRSYIYSYAIYRATTLAGPYSQVTANQISSTFTDTGLAAGTYFYKVTGVEPDAGETYASPVQSITLP